MKNISGHANAANLQLQKVQELKKISAIQGFSTKQNTFSKLVAQHRGLNNQQSISWGLNNQQSIGLVLLHSISMPTFSKRQ